MATLVEVLQDRKKRLESDIVMKASQLDKLNNMRINLAKELHILSGQISELNKVIELVSQEPSGDVEKVEK